MSGNGIEDGTIVFSVTCGANQCEINLTDIYGNNKKAYCDLNTEVSFTSRRNVFYEVPHYSQIKVMFNRDQGSVKRFKTINYEGSKSKIVDNLLDDQYYNLTSEQGWYVDSIFTNKQTGSIPEFIEKEGKWYNYIKGVTTTSSNIDTSEFSVQGLGVISSTSYQS